MDRRELYFNAERTDGDTITLVFNNPHETKLAFRALVDLVGANMGICLQAKPTYAVILDRLKGGWVIWLRLVIPYITEVEPTKRYRLTLMDGKISNGKVTHPVCIYSNAVLPVEETSWD